MNFIWQSLQTRSYWKHVLFSLDSWKTFFSVIGVVWGLIEIGDYFNLITQNDFPPCSVWILLIISFILMVVSKRPVNNVIYRLPGRDITVQVRIGDLFKLRGQKVISTNTTFDTQLSDGIIATESMQGQFTTKFFPQSLSELDAQIDGQLVDKTFTIVDKVAGKVKRYDMGTVIKLKLGSETFYLLAMSNMNRNNVAQTNFENVIYSLEQLWDFIATRGEMEEIIMPLIGTGRGRIPTNRKQLIASISHSFIKASYDRVFTNKLTIVIRNEDVKNFGINLFEVKDLLNHYLP